MKINIFSATGQLGQKIVNELLKLEVETSEIVLSVRNQDKAKELFPNIESRYCDLNDTDSIYNSIKSGETVYVIPTTDPVEKRIDQLFHLLEAAKKNSAKRFVWSGLTHKGVDSRFVIAPYFMYAETKIKQSGLDHTILRNGIYFDPVFDWVPELIRMRRLPYPVQNGKVAYISRDDIASATAKVLSEVGHENKTYELTGYRDFTMDEIAAVISGFTGIDIKFKRISDEDYIIMCNEQGEPEELSKILVTLYHGIDNGEFRSSSDFESLMGKRAMSPNKYFKEHYNKENEHPDI